MEFLVVFTNDLTTIKFVAPNGDTVDPRAVLFAIASKAAQLRYEEVREEIKGHINSQTWKVVDSNDFTITSSTGLTTGSNILELQYCCQESVDNDHVVRFCKK